VEMPAGEAAKEKYCLGVPKEYFVAGMDPRVESAIKEKISFLEKQGHKIEEVSLPHSEFALACYYIIATSEASANLARYDGMRYGAAKGGDTVTDAYFAARGQGFGAEVRRRIMLGTYVLSAGYYDAYYVRAQKVRSLIKRDFDRALAQVDAIIAPVSPTLPFAIGEKTDDPVQMYLADIFTISVNLAGVPSLAMPCGAADGLPVGLQIIGRHFDESTLFNVGKIIEA